MAEIRDTPPFGDHGPAPDVPGLPSGDTLRVLLGAVLLAMGGTLAIVALYLDSADRVREGVRWLPVVLQGLVVAGLYRGAGPGWRSGLVVWYGLGALLAGSALIVLLGLALLTGKSATTLPLEVVRLLALMFGCGSGILSASQISTPVRSSAIGVLMLGILLAL